MEKKLVLVVLGSLLVISPLASLAQDIGILPPPVISKCGSEGQRWCKAPPASQTGDLPWLGSLCRNGLQPCRTGSLEGTCRTCCEDVGYRCPAVCGPANDSDCVRPVMLSGESYASAFVALGDYQVGICGANYDATNQQDRPLRAADLLLASNTRLIVHAGDLVQNHNGTGGMDHCSTVVNGWRPTVGVTAPYDFEMVKSLLQTLQDQGKFVSAKGNHDQNALNTASGVSNYFTAGGEFSQWFPLVSGGSGSFDPYCRGYCSHRVDTTNSIYYLLLHLFYYMPPDGVLDDVVDDIVEHLRRGSTQYNFLVVSTHRATDVGGVEQDLVRQLARRFGAELVLTGHFHQYDTEKQPGEPFYLELPASAAAGDAADPKGFTTFSVSGSSLIGQNSWPGYDPGQLPPAFLDPVVAPQVAPPNGGPMLFFHYTNANGDRDVATAIKPGETPLAEFMFNVNLGRFEQREGNGCLNYPFVNNPHLAYFRANPGPSAIIACMYEDDFSGGPVQCSQPIVDALNAGDRIYYNTDPWHSDFSIRPPCPWQCDQPRLQLNDTVTMTVNFTTANGAEHWRSIAIKKVAGSDGTCN